MSKQTSVTTFFSVRKRPVDQHPAKTRKLETLESPEAYVTSVTSALDDHLAPPVRTSSDVADTSLPPSHSFTNTPKLQTSSAAADSKRGHKRDSFGIDQRQNTPRNEEENVEKEQAIRFTIGSEIKSAKKRLDLDGVGEKRGQQGSIRSRRARPVAAFKKMGNLSPVKVPHAKLLTEKSGENVSFVKKALLSPKKPEGSSINASMNKAVVKLTPAEVKTKLGQVNKLQDLKARLQQIKDFKIPPNLTPKKSDLPPRLSSGPISLEICSPTKQSQRKATSSVMSVISPRKLQPEELLTALTQPTKSLTLPTKYRYLAEVFRNLDHIVALRHNRREVTRVAELKSSMQNAMKKNFNDDYLRQIKCVFPNAYKYQWEQLVNSYGIKKEDYELQMYPNFDYDEKTGEQQAVAVTSGFIALNPKHLVERLRIFNGLLLRLAKDHHQTFLRGLDSPIEMDDSGLTRWHRDFDPDTCPEIDKSDLPTKPDVTKLTNAADFIQTANKIFGVNKRLENALKEQAEREKVRVEMAKGNESVEEKPKIKKGLEGLPPALLERILAKEKAKQIQEMTEGSGERKEKNLLEELVQHGPKIINCYKSECQRQGRKGLTADNFFKFAANSNGRKSPKEMESLVRLFAKVAPEFLEFVVVRKTEYIRQKNNSVTDHATVTARLNAILTERKKCG